MSLLQTTNPSVWLNAITFVRIPLAGFVAVLLARPGIEVPATRVALVCIVLIELSDWLDGKLARRYGLTTKFGSVFDPFADAVSRFLVFWGLTQIGYCAAYVVPVIVVRDVSVADIRTWLGGVGASAGARWSGKAKAVVQGAGALALILGPSFWGGWWTTVSSGVSLVVALVVGASLLDYSIAAINVSRQGTRSEPQPTSDDGAGMGR